MAINRKISRCDEVEPVDSRRVISYAFFIAQDDILRAVVWFFFVNRPRRHVLGSFIFGSILAFLRQAHDLSKRSSISCTPATSVKIFPCSAAQDKGHTK